MGFLDKLKKTKKIGQKQENQENQFVEEKTQFVADISMYELEKANWEEFAGILKANKILPNSYIKKPASVDVKLSKKGQPMVLLTFNSATCFWIKFRSDRKAGSDDEMMIFILPCVLIPLRRYIGAFMVCKE